MSRFRYTCDTFPIYEPYHMAKIISLPISWTIIHGSIRCLYGENYLTFLRFQSIGMTFSWEFGILGSHKILS